MSLAPCKRRDERAMRQYSGEEFANGVVLTGWGRGMRLAL